VPKGHGTLRAFALVVAANSFVLSA